MNITFSTKIKNAGIENNYTAAFKVKYVKPNGVIEVITISSSIEIELINTNNEGRLIQFKVLTNGIKIEGDVHPLDVIPVTLILDDIQEIDLYLTDVSTSHVIYSANSTIAVSVMFVQIPLSNTFKMINLGTVCDTFTAESSIVTFTSPTALFEASKSTVFILNGSKYINGVTVSDTNTILLNYNTYLPSISSGVQITDYILNSLPSENTKFKGYTNIDYSSHKNVPQLTMPSNINISTLYLYDALYNVLHTEFSTLNIDLTTTTHSKYFDSVSSLIDKDYAIKIVNSYPTHLINDATELKYFTVGKTYYITFLDGATALTDNTTIINIDNDNRTFTLSSVFGAINSVIGLTGMNNTYFKEAKVSDFIVGQTYRVLSGSAIINNVTYTIGQSFLYSVDAITTSLVATETNIYEYNTFLKNITLLNTVEILNSNVNEITIVNNNLNPIDIVITKLNTLEALIIYETLESFTLQTTGNAVKQLNDGIYQISITNNGVTIKYYITLLGQIETCVMNNIINTLCNSNCTCSETNTIHSLHQQYLFSTALTLYNVITELQKNIISNELFYINSLPTNLNLLFDFNTMLSKLTDICNQCKN